jgi:hypothetical protein
MRIKISATFEGKCDLCKKNGKVFSVGDEDTKKALTICENCVNKFHDTPTSEMIEKYGKKNYKAFKRGIIIE